MASIVPYRNGWRAYLFINGRRKTKFLPDREEATRWANLHEGNDEYGRSISWFPRHIPKLLPTSELRRLPEVDASSTVSGVYFLWNQEGSPVYIGQSRNIASRLMTHRKVPPTDFTFATFIKVPHPWQLALEQLYIEAYVEDRADESGGVVLANKTRR
jgi:hypothetical protein